MEKMIKLLDPTQMQVIYCRIYMYMYVCIHVHNTSYIHLNLLLRIQIDLLEEDKFLMV